MPETQEKQAVTPAVAMAQRLTAEIMKRRMEKLAEGIKAKPRTSIWASQIPECARQGVYEFLNWQDKKLHDWKLEALFQAGRVNEDAYKAQLRELGIELVEDGAPISEDMRLKYGINGYLDWRVKWEGKRVPFEAKMVHPNIFSNIRSGVDGIADMKRMGYMRKYVRQGLIYLLGTNEEVLVFAFTDGRGNWTFPILELDYKAAEDCLKMAETIKKAVDARELPERIPYDHEICGRCAFAHICIPDINADPRVKVINNAGLAALLERRDEIKDKASECEKIEKKIRQAFEGVEAGVFTIGNFIVTRKDGPRTYYEVPDDLKAKFAVKKTVYRNEIERFAEPDPESIYLEPARVVSFEDFE